MTSAATELQLCQLVTKDPKLTSVPKSPGAQAEDDAQEDKPQCDKRAVGDEDSPRSQSEAELRTLPGMQSTSGHDGQAACAGQAGQLQSGHWAKYAPAIRATLGHETSAPADRAAKEIVEEAIYKTNSP